MRPAQHILFLFLDGVGLGTDNPWINPFARAKMPVLQELLGGQRLLYSALPPDGTALETHRATLISLDTGLGVPGVPQSATGQAALLTGKNVPQEIGYHYGPKPDPAVAGLIRSENLFSVLRQEGKKEALLNAYPPRYFSAIASGRRLYSAIPLAVTSAGIELKTQADMIEGRALSADFTAQGWRTQLNIPQAPLLVPRAAGQRLAELARGLDFAMFEYWLSDYAGHGQDMEQACQLLETFDQVLGGLIEAWDDDAGLILVTSDHGNLEDLSTRRHTQNPVPALLIGSKELRESFSEGVRDLTGITPAILHSLRAV